MATTDGDEVQLYPPRGENQHSDEPGDPSKPSVNLPPAGNPPPTKPNPAPDDPPAAASPTPHRFLTPTEWARVAHGIGAIQEGETHQVVHPTCWYWPPKGLPDGLYRDVVTQRTRYCIGYQLLSMLRWFLMVLQITIGAVLTALGSVKLEGSSSTPITALAVVNTMDAGLLALLHNSGLPDRYRLDMAEFSKVEDSLRELLDTGIVKAHQTVDDVLTECFAQFHHAKATVLANKPEAYTNSSTASGKGGIAARPQLTVQAVSANR
ncbi:hypothetical protein VTK26DRAFT_5795 [Humicola hyalothermophila]